MKKMAGNETHIAQIQRSEVSESTGYRHLDNAQIEKLYTSYNLMKDFCEHISNQEPNKVSQLLENYAERQVRVEILPKNVMHILDKRIQRMLKNKKLKKNWSNQDIQILYWTFCHYCRINKISSVEKTKQEDWENISNLIPGSNPDSCMFKILDLKKIKLSEQKWTENQSNLLLQIGIQQNKKNWRLIAQELYKQNSDPNKVFRNAKLCKQHWVCYLNPTLKKGAWSMEEDKQLMNLIIMNKGGRKWAEIAKIFGGRTQNALKNRYTLIIQRLRRQSEGANDLELIKEYYNTLNKRCASEKLKKTGNKQIFNPENLKKEKTQTRQSNILGQEQNEGESEQNILQAEKGKELILPVSFPQHFQITPEMLNSSETRENFQIFNYIPSLYNYNQCFWIFPNFSPKSQ